MKLKNLIRKLTRVVLALAAVVILSLFQGLSRLIRALSAGEE